MSINKFIKFKELVKYIPLSRATIWRRMKVGNFPKPIDLGGNAKNSAKAWSENDILVWVEKQQTISTAQRAAKDGDEK